ncbi:MAG: hypothetical protein ACK5MV_08530 [Aminipila sp.]
MTKTEKIIELLEQGKTAQETFNALVGVSIGYIYKVRSKHKKSNPREYRTALQEEIERLYKLSVPPTQIAEKVGCSKQYVYKVLAGKSKKKLLPFIRSYSTQDEYLTPLYAVIPISRYLRPHSLIWCPFDFEESLYVRYFKQQGHEVVATHIKNGQDFFQTEPPQGCQYIISNPPYSLKTEIFERLCNLNITFAMLVNNTGIFTAKGRFNLFKEGVEQMVFPTRIAFMKSYTDTKTLAAPPFDSCYICRGILPEKLVFEEIDKKFITL